MILIVFSGVSDIIVACMAFNRLLSIRMIRVYKKDSKRIVTFRRSKANKKYANVKVLLQIIFAFIFSFAFHIPFFDEYKQKTKVGLCNFYGGATMGKYKNLSRASSALQLQSIDSKCKVTN